MATPRINRGPVTARVLVLGSVVLIGACGGGGNRDALPATSARPSILLVTLDTTRADAIGPDATGVETPAFNALAARGRRFRQAYATVPETLPSHVSMMTGLYPAGHGVHENARNVPAHHAVAAERLQSAGYRTAAFLSAFVLAKRFGLARGFDVYDDELPPGEAERPSKATTDRALAYLAQPSEQPLFLWVHYFDPHAPYEPPEPFRSRYEGRPYLGEVAAMDEQLGRLVQAFERHAPGPVAMVIASDHGEGLGDHGESQHGNLLYQSTMHVPVVIVGPGIAPGVSDSPVSLRRVYHTVLDLAGVDPTGSLRRPDPEVVLGEAMKPYLWYGWQPQIMAVAGRLKAIDAGTLELYDVVADPRESRNLLPAGSVPPPVRKALDDYPVPSLDATPVPETLTEEARRNLASLGYVSASATPVVGRGAPRPVDMVGLFDVIEQASGLFVEERYADVIPLLKRILEADPSNLDAMLRLATAHSILGHSSLAIESFRKAAEIAPRSPDVRLSLALHYARGKEWPQAAALLERIVADTPDRLPAVEGLARIRERQDRIEDAVALWQKVHALRAPTAAELVHLGELAMYLGRTPLALASFESARAMQGPGFAHDFELGLLYVDARRLADARAALDRVPPSHPEYPMALFKRAQVSVLLNEPDRAARIEAARRHADASTRQLVANERLFRR